ncbi:MAG TPA: ABC transporter substrate-binding protein [Steroidobacteraceae bacterium]|jgi:phospholipid transport system substrate-binding protein|nr:ABC transporter substrate-binding protein [Steroidobacteraceae bacterium]
MQTRTTWIAMTLSVALVTVPLTLARAAAPAAGASEVDASGPYQLVQSAANTMLMELDAHRAEYHRDPAKLRDLVNRVLLPHFDTQLAARAVLGRHWNMASPDQRQRFITAFYNSLLRNYGDALLDFTSNRMQVLPYRGDANAKYAVVNTRIRKSDGSQVSVNYNLEHTDQGWKVWDVVIEGISYDKSFQQDFGEQIDRQGIDAVITRLEQGATPAAIQRTTGNSGH